ncbi:ABC transporter ATP-binding protein, partial [Pseudomonas sp. MWU13-2625]
FFDEPFSILDAAFRERLAGEVSPLPQSQGIAALTVSLGSPEALAYLDRAGVRDGGCIPVGDQP